MRLNRPFSAVALVIGTVFVCPVVAAPSIRKLGTPISSSVHSTSTILGSKGTNAKSSNTNKKTASIRTLGTTTKPLTNVTSNTKSVSVTPQKTSSVDSSRAGLRGNLVKGISSKLSANSVTKPESSSSNITSNLEARVNNLEKEVATKQNALESGNGININGNTISLSQEITDLPAALSDGNSGLINVSDLKNAVGTAGVGETPGTGLTGAVESLQDTIGDENSGLVKKVNSLEAASQLYNAGAGIVVIPGVTTSAPSTIGLDVITSANKKYIFKTDANGNGTWQVLEIEDNWDPGF